VRVRAKLFVIAAAVVVAAIAAGSWSSLRVANDRLMDKPELLYLKTITPAQYAEPYAEPSPTAPNTRVDGRTAVLSEPSG